MAGKNLNQKVDKKVFNADIAEVLGIEECDIIDIYGFTEQMGLNYPDCSAGWKHVHSYSDVIVRDETDLSVVEMEKLDCFSLSVHCNIRILAI